MAVNMKEELTRPFRPRGEAKVWLCAMGLALGLLMTVFLLYVIVVNGIAGFWPRRVVATELESGEKLLGEVVKVQEKRVTTLGETRPPTYEWQFYVANKEFTRVPFRYVDKKKLGDIRHPDDVIKIERLENSFALGYPQKLVLADGSVVPAEDPEFAEKLEGIVEAANERREEIKEIEKFKIGEINREMEELQFAIRAEKRNEKAGKTRDADVIKAAELRLDELNQEYQVLAKKARELRERQHEEKFIYSIVSGEEVTISGGEIIRYHYPNRLSWLQRLGLTLTNIWHFLSEDPREANTEGGVFPAIFGTFIMTLLMCIVVTPFGVIAAVYIHEYAHQGVILRFVRIAVNNLAGVPSIVFGVFGLGFFVYVIGGSIDKLFFSDALPTPTFGTGGVLWASLTLAVLTLPVVIVAAEEALSAVPKGVREASYACGASKWQTIYRVVSPAALPGVMTGMILAMARGAGEVAPLMLVGVVKMAPELPVNTVPPFVHLEQKFMHLGFHIFDLGFQSPDAEAAKPMVFATTLLLIVLVISLNLTGIIVRDRLRRKYQLGAF